MKLFFQKVFILSISIGYWLPGHVVAEGNINSTSSTYLQERIIENRGNLDKTTHEPVSNTCYSTSSTSLPSDADDVEITDTDSAVSGWVGFGVTTVTAVAMLLPAIAIALAMGCSH